MFCGAVNRLPWDEEPSYKLALPTLLELRK